MQVYPNVQFGGRKEVSESALNQPHEDQPVWVSLAEQTGRLDRKDEAAISTVISNTSQWKALDMRLYEVEVDIQSQHP